MNEESCHNLVHLNSAFLNRLYESNDISVKKILSVGNDVELKTLIGVTYLK